MVAVVEEVGDVVDMVADASRAGPEDFAGEGDQAFGAGDADQGLRGGEEARDEKEWRIGGDLSVGENGGFT